MFYGRAVNQSRHRKLGRKRGSQIWLGIIVPAATMPERMPTAKGFGARSRQSTSALLRPGSLSSLKAIGRREALKRRRPSAKLTFGAASELCRQRLNESVKIKRRTREYYGEVLAALADAG